MQVPSGLDEPGPACPGASKMLAKNSLAQWGGKAEVWTNAEGRRRTAVEEKGEKKGEKGDSGKERSETGKENGTHTRRERRKHRSGPAGRWQQVVEPNTWVSRHPAACVGGDPGLGRWAAVAVSTTMMESTQKKLRRRKRAEGNGEEKEKAERRKAERK